MGSLLTVTAKTGAFAVTREGWHVPRGHLGDPDRFEKDFVEVAERFVGTPYLWGGKSSFGIDCSGLVQIALNAAGTGCPRDSDMQQDGLGRDIDPAQSNRVQRGDLIFWKGHVAIARDADTIVHANAHHMATAIENTADAIARIKAAGSEIVADQAAVVKRDDSVFRHPEVRALWASLEGWLQAHATDTILRGAQLRASLKTTQQLGASYDSLRSGTTGRESSFSRQALPEFCHFVLLPLRKESARDPQERAQGRPGARRTRGLVCKG